MDNYFRLRDEYALAAIQKYPSWETLQRLAYQIREHEILNPEAKEAYQERTMKLKLSEKSHGLIMAGVGSRSTPQNVLNFMEEFCYEVSLKLNWVGYSGGAVGADTACAKGFARAKGKCIQFIPWPGFNGLKPGRDIICLSNSQWEKNIKEMISWGVFHPDHVARLSRGGRALHARNFHQVLGWNNYPAASLVVCWTEKGQTIGGTATAIKLAQAHGITVVNLGNPKHMAVAKAFLVEVKKL